MANKDGGGEASGAMANSSQILFCFIQGFIHYLSDSLNYMDFKVTTNAIRPKSSNAWVVG